MSSLQSQCSSEEKPVYFKHPPNSLRASTQLDSLIYSKRMPGHYNTPSLTCQYEDNIKPHINP